jgi:hypothetical protein
MSRQRETEAAPGTPLGAAPRSPVKENTMPRRRLTHTIRQLEPICPGCWEVRTQTEDGRRFTAFGVTRQQAIYRAHQKAKPYGQYAYPTAVGHEKRNAVKIPHDQVRRV